MCITQVSGNVTFAPVAFLAQSQHGPGLYAVFPAHLLNKTAYPKGMWAYRHNVLPDSDDPPTSGPPTEWTPHMPLPSIVTQHLLVDDNPAPDRPIPLAIGTVTLGPVLYRSLYSGTNDAWLPHAGWALASLDLVVAFVNANHPLSPEMFDLPGQDHGFDPPATSFTLKEGSQVRVCSQFLGGNKDVIAKVCEVNSNGCAFDVLPQNGILEPGCSGAPVIDQPEGGAPRLVGYVIQGLDTQKNKTTVARADAALRHLATFCPALGLSIADASQASRAVWNAAVPERQSFYQLMGNWP